MKRCLAVTAVGLTLAGALGVANAQQGSPMMNQSDQGMMQGPGYMMQGPNSPMRPGMMMGGMMGNMHNPQMMIVMMDTNADGQLSLEEFQAVHTRMFNYLDDNGDGQITADEMRKR